uniref:Protein kinase domain-containing protein n=2 Tax=Oryza rufipogon TaxID=4529 RepID=A0A0E0RFJ1_ORYRU
MELAIAKMKEDQAEEAGFEARAAGGRREPRQPYLFYAFSSSPNLLFRSARTPQPNQNFRPSPGVLRDGLEVAIRKQANARPNRYDEMPEMRREQLDWSSRFRIIHGITQGIIYLHTHSGKPTIVHLDLKPDILLLDSDMNPKIGDFGLAKVLKDDEVNASVRGTLGYMPPEYIVEGVISVKNDVYGFGVTLLETISGMSDSGRDARHQASIEWAWNVRLSGGIHKLLDPSLCDESQLKEIKRCMEIGLLCTQNKPSDRPTMPDVLEMLQGKKKVPTPKQPGYIKRVRAAGRHKQPAGGRAAAAASGAAGAGREAAAGAGWEAAADGQHVLFLLFSVLCDEC